MGLFLRMEQPLSGIKVEAGLRTSAPSRYRMHLKILSLTIFSLILGLVSIEAAEVAALEVGQRIPSAEVRTDQNAALSLTSALGNKPTILIFYRGGWCPYCTRHLAALAEAQPELLALGFQIVALSPDSPARLRARPSHQKIPYVLLSDSEAHAMRAFGVAFKVEDAVVDKYKQVYGIDLEGDSGQTHHLLPHPAVFVIDATGVIRFAHVNPDYKVRLTPEEIVAAAHAAH